MKKLILQLSSERWDVALNISSELVHYGEQAVPELLILLDDNKSQVRDLAALTLRDINSNLAVHKLFEVIKKRKKEGSISTLVYALELLDCRDYFLDVFNLCLSSKADVSMSAMEIFFTQGFIVNDDNIAKASELLEEWYLVKKDVERYGHLKDRLNDFLE